MEGLVAGMNNAELCVVVAAEISARGTLEGGYMGMLRCLHDAWKAGPGAEGAEEVPFKVGKDGLLSCKEVSLLMAQGCDVEKHNADSDTNVHSRKARRGAPRTSRSQSVHRRRDDGSSDDGKNVVPRTTRGLRTIKLKTALCRNWLNGSCSYGSKCGFAHGEHEVTPDCLVKSETTL
eukprot:TRINITY_DN5623_c0_g1_i4.p1 TRINITY_DN5623_c0_g1~~TRINITY_DN5623_c0_g1_i4.p1  ORF type:complete len:191 (+),score=46.35 TRINITY_DN5623_c0_g1_i4:44-574(+)